MQILTAGYLDFLYDLFNYFYLLWEIKSFIFVIKSSRASCDGECKYNYFLMVIVCALPRKCLPILGKIAEKNDAEECIFDYIALYFECQFNKNSFLQGYFFSVFVGLVCLLFKFPTLKV